MDATLFSPAQARVNSLTTEERNAHVLSCELLCRSLARRAAYGVPGVDVEDLEQEALVACMEASRRWMPDQGSKFSTYATPCIQRHLSTIITRIRCEANVQIEEWDSVTDPHEERDGTFADDTGDDLGLTPHQLVAVERLPDRVRQTVRLVLRGFSPDRVAEQLGIPVKDVKLSLRNAEKQLRRDLAWVELPGLFGITGELDDAA